MGFWDALAREVEAQRAEPQGPQPVSNVAPGRWWQRNDIPQPEPEPEAEEVFLNLNDPAQARQPIVGSEVFTTQTSNQSWQKPTEQGNQFETNVRQRAQMQRDQAAGKYNNEGTDVVSARERAAILHELNQQHVFDSKEHQRMPTRFNG
jgi:hypothetical protein